MPWRTDPLRVWRRRWALLAAGGALLLLVVGAAVFRPLALPPAVDPRAPAPMADISDTAPGPAVTAWQVTAWQPLRDRPVVVAPTPPPPPLSFSLIGIIEEGGRTVAVFADQAGDLHYLGAGDGSGALEVHAIDAAGVDYRWHDSEGRLTLGAP